MRIIIFIYIFIISFPCVAQGDTCSCTITYGYLKKYEWGKDWFSGPEKVQITFTNDSSVIFKSYIQLQEELPAQQVEFDTLFLIDNNYYYRFGKEIYTLFSRGLFSKKINTIRYYINKNLSSDSVYSIKKVVYEPVKTDIYINDTVFMYEVHYYDAFLTSSSYPNVEDFKSLSYTENNSSTVFFNFSKGYLKKIRNHVIYKSNDLKMSIGCKRR